MSDTEGINGDWPRADHIQCKRVLDQYLTEIEQARAEVAQERESVRHQFRMLEELRAEFRRVKAEAERYRAALVKIDEDCGACEIVLPGSPDPCPAEYPGDQDMWCTGCLARTALSKEEP